MKFVLVIVALYALYWLLRRSLRSVMSPRQKSPAAAEPKPILACAHCGLHLPRDEALIARGQVFCDEAHRRAYEQAHPGS